MNELMSLNQLVETAFERARSEPTFLQWKSVSMMAGAASVRMSSEGQLFMAASLEGVAEEARRQALALMKEAA